MGIISLYCRILQWKTYVSHHIVLNTGHTSSNLTLPWSREPISRPPSQRITTRPPSHDSDRQEINKTQNQRNQFLSMLPTLFDCTPLFIQRKSPTRKPSITSQASMFMVYRGDSAHLSNPKFSLFCLVVETGRRVRWRPLDWSSFKLKKYFHSDRPVDTLDHGRAFGGLDEE